MSRFFSVGPFLCGVAARFGAAFCAVIFVAVTFFAVAFFAVVFLEVVLLLISAPELALDRSTRFRARRKGARVHLTYADMDIYSCDSWHEPPRPQMRSTPFPSRSGGGFSPFSKGASVRSMSLRARCESRSPARPSPC